MPYLVEDAAKWVHERGYKLVGQDAIGFENSTPSAPSTTTCSSAT